MSKRKTLEEQIGERKQQAVYRKIESKAKLVAKTLGKNREWHESRRVQKRAIYEREKLFISDSYSESDGSDGLMMGCLTEIVYKGETVYKNGGGEILTYIPGSWERRLNALYQKADALDASNSYMEEEARRLKAMQEEAEERKKWGL